MFAKPKLWGLIKGKTISRERAIRWLEEDDMFGWECQTGVHWYNIWKTIREMCLEAKQSELYTSMLEEVTC